MPTAKTLLLTVTAASTTFFLGIFVSPLIEKTKILPKVNENFSIEKREAGFTFINPLLECEQTNNQGYTSLKSMSEAVEKVVEANSEETISVYYRDLSNGPWYGYNEEATFAPQSLLKVPTAIAYMKYFENEPSTLLKKIVYSEELESNLKPEDDLVVGESYTAKQLIERALTLSDNIAYRLLATDVPEKYLVKTHRDLGIPLAYKETPQDFVSVKQYASLFRVLYNSSYLYRQNSEYLLFTLSQADFKDGLVAGLPEGVVIAHKFGILSKVGIEEKQLHDCGVIYYPEKPYILCVMSKGTDMVELRETIKEISEAVYRSVDQVN